MPNQAIQRILTVLITGIYFPAQAVAAQPDTLLTSSLIKTTGMLSLIIGLVYGLAWVLQKSQKNLKSGSQHLSLIETLPLGRNERLCLIKSGDRYLVLGVSPQGVSRIDEIPADSISATAPAQNSWQWAQKILQRH